MSLTVAEKEILTTTAPTGNGGREIYYPESDGKPMGETAFHVNVITHLYQTLRYFFSEENNVVVIADMMFYFEEGNPQKVIAPDVMVVKGVANYPRRTFQLWNEKAPDVVFEISSRGTWKEDIRKKYLLYQAIGVKEYYIFDPEYDYLKDEPLVAYHLIEGVFKKMSVEQGRISSPALGLEIVDTGETLRLFDVDKQRFVPTAQELSVRNEELGAENEELRRELAKLKGR